LGFFKFIIDVKDKYIILKLFSVQYMDELFDKLNLQIDGAILSIFLEIDEEAHLSI
jgi:hypothetical protein